MAVAAAKEDRKFVRKQTKKIRKAILARMNDVAENGARCLHFTVYEDFERPSDILILAASKVARLLNKKDRVIAKLRTDTSKCWIQVRW